MSVPRASPLAPAARAAGTSGDSLGTLKVLSIDRKERRRNPAPPFTTSTLQQEAARKLGFNARRTMRLAQQLYEGIDIGGDGAIGLITYMRTDSVNLADEAVREIREVAGRLYGQAEVAEEPRVYKTKSKNAQEAHEAVRPTSAAIVPADIEGKLDADQYKLYSLIWKRAVASQMSHAVFDTVAVDMLAGPDGAQRHVLRANGSTLVKPGYMSVYQEDADDVKRDDDDHVLPAMNEGDKVALAAFKAEQHFTEPPPRYSEASLVKALEEHGIGRPSTYATIISTLQDREYVEMDNRRFIPTDIGKIVGRFLTQYFHRYVEYGFTAALEDELDAVSRGEEDWTLPLSKFWKPFIKEVEKIEKTVSREQVAMAREIGTHPESGKPMSVRMGRYGPFVQIGTKDDEEKPKFAGLRPGQKMDNITMEQALELFKLPRTLGQTAEGEDVMTNVGRFGPYIKYGAKYVSLKEDDPYTVELPRALELIRLKQEADANRIIATFESDGIQVLNGRYGPYVTNGKKNAKIPKDREPKSITLEEARVMIEQAPERGTGRFGRGKRVTAPAKDSAAAKAGAKAAGKAAAGKAAGNGVEAADAAGKTAKATKGAKAEKKTSAQSPTAAKKTAAGHTPAQRAAAPARAGKSARSSGQAAPKGVTNVVRKGQSAAAKAHARKTAARGGTSGTAGKSTKPAAKRARGARD